ncbi:MAG TPA: hypothetical protein DEA90_11745 [Opitutae bacterium]|nr:hypothetical protein [Opitutae bacterium]|tara:strand:- start:14880 stop:15683 length:804 start_codon:yes stop_codon:yes gene_type:complete
MIHAPIAYTGLGLLITTMSASAAIDLDFGELDLTSEMNSASTSSFSSTAIGNDGITDIYAQLSVVDGNGFTGDFAGSAAGDVKIGQYRNTTTQYSLTLYQDAALSEIYAPASSFTYDLFFYDIDGHDDYGDQYYDVVTVYTPSVATYTTTTDLTITTNGDGSITASGKDTAAIDGQQGLTSFTPEQADVAISFTFTDTATVIFDYTVINTNSTGNRNLLIDANNLAFAEGTTETLEVVPEPAAFGLLCSAMSLAYVVVGRRRIHSEK